MKALVFSLSQRIGSLLVPVVVCLLLGCANGSDGGKGYDSARSAGNTGVETARNEDSLGVTERLAEPGRATDETGDAWHPLMSETAYVINELGVDTVQYIVRDGYAVIEGDMILGTVAEVDSVSRGIRDGKIESRAAGTNLGKWPGGIIPYTIAAGFGNTSRGRIQLAMKNWASKSQNAVQFVPKASQHRFWVRIVLWNRDYASTSVGMQRGSIMQMPPGSSLGLFTHELGHAIGQWHEQARQDRDTAVRIVYENIADGHKSQFDKRGTKRNQYGPYDLSSVMHYGPRTFSKNGKATIVPLNGRKITRTDEPSQGDGDGVRLRYRES
jgi:hypothetical protein